MNLLKIGFPYSEQVLKPRYQSAQGQPVAPFAVLSHCYRNLHVVYDNQLYVL